MKTRQAKDYSHMINVPVVQTDHHGNSPGNRLSPSTCMVGLKGGEEEGEGGVRRRGDVGLQFRKIHG